MRRFVVVFLGAALSASAANAADILGLRTPARIVPLAPAFTWTGCYLGGHAGGGWARTDWTNTANTTAFGDLTLGQGYRQTDGGFIGGGQVGCNYQVNSWVFGIEGSFAGATIHGDVPNSAFGVATGVDVFTTRVESLAMATGRVGYAWTNWLFYAKGGYAGGQVKFSVAEIVSPAGSGSSSRWHNGWTVGGGVEYAVTPNWIIGVEYDYADLLTRSHEVGGSTGLYTFDVHPQIHQALARVSYKF
jgi:outer membrane immunogenic protein